MLLGEKNRCRCVPNFKATIIDKFQFMAATPISVFVPAYPIKLFTIFVQLGFSSDGSFEGTDNSLVALSSNGVTDKTSR